MSKKEQHIFKKTVLPNGLTVVTERQKSFQSLSVGIWVKAGTRHESESEAGVSHFLEHMLFKGTKTRTSLEIAREVDRVGGEFNAFTAREYTCFHILLLSRDVKLAMEILGDVVLNSSFLKDELHRERSVILQEIAMVEESPEEMVHDFFFEEIYPKQGLGKPILGTIKSIGRLTRAQVVGYFRKNYQPKNLIVSVSGDVSHEAVLKELTPLRKKLWPGRSSTSSRFSGSASSSRLIKPSYFGAPGDLKPRVQAGKWWYPRPTEQVHLVWGVEGPRYSDPDRFAAFLLNVYLGGGMSSTLFQEIREKNGLAYTVYSNLSPFIDSGVFSIYAATRPSQVPLCLKLIEECVQQLKTNLLSKDDLEIIKDNLKGTILLSADSVEARMSSIARNELYFGRYVPVKEVCKSIDLVKAEDIRRVANKLLGSNERSIVALGPKPSARLRKKLDFELI